MNTARWLALLTLALVASTASGQAKDWFTIVGGNTFDLTADGAKSLATRIPLAPSPGASVPEGSKLVPQTIDVSNKMGRAPELRPLFKVTLESETPTDAASLVVKVEPADVLPVGPYGLLVRISAAPGDKTTPTQNLALTLNVPAPELRLQPFSVDIERAFPVVFGQSVKAAPALFSELTAKAPVRDIRLHTIRDSVPAKADSGTLIVRLDGNSVGAGAAASAPVSVSGEFPLGKTSGKLEARSRDLAAPVQATFEVRVIENKAWIPVLAFLGALLGYGLRTVMKRRMEYQAALVTASDFISSIERARLSSLDADYRSQLAKVREQLDSDTRVGKTAAVVNEAIKKAKPELEAAKTKLDAALAALLPRVQELRTLVDVGWKTPGGIGGPLSSLVSEVFLLEQDLLGRDAKTATDRLASACAVKLAELVNAAGAYGTTLAKYSGRLAAAALPLPEPTQRQLADASALVAKAFPGAAWSPLPRSTVAQANTFLTAIYGDAALCRGVLEQLEGDACLFLDWAQKQLKVSPTDVRLQALVKVTRECLDRVTMSEELESASFSTTALDWRVEALRAEWLQLGQCVAPAATVAELEALIGAGKWKELVALLVSKLPKAAVGVPLGGGGAAQGFSTDLPSHTAVLLSQAGPSRATASVKVGTSVLDGSEGELYRMTKSNELQAIALTVLFALIFIYGVMAFYDDAWVGTTKEMLALFILAFSIDMTADGVVGALKRA